MRSSFKLGRYAGIDVGLHWSVGLILVLLTVTLSGSILPIWAPGFTSLAYFLAAAATAGLFMFSIVAHELGHSVVAERNEVKVRGITLFALGGVAVLESEPKSPGVAARIALAGPAVSLAVGVVSIVASFIAGAVGLSALASAGFLWLGIVNLVLAGFNMLPALPLDGGRVLQAGLWKRTGDQHQATIRAATIGRYVGWAIIAFGVWQFLQGLSGLWTILIGFFIISTARGEEFRARVMRRREQGGAGLFDPFQPPTGSSGGWGTPGAPFGPPRAEDRVDDRFDHPFGRRPVGRFDDRFGPFPPRDPRTAPHRGDVIDVEVRPASDRADGSTMTADDDRAGGR